MNETGILDRLKVRHSFSRAAWQYDTVAELQREVAHELLKRYPVINHEGSVMDMGCGTGYLTRLLLEQVSDKKLAAMDIAFPMLEMCRMKCPEENLRGLVCADAEKLPFADSSFSSLYSNLAFQWCNDVEQLLQECRRVVDKRGSLVFSTFGPFTLNELQKAWHSVDGYVHVNSFPTLSELEGVLYKVGFSKVETASVLMEREYPDVLSLMYELKGLGAHNVAQGRNRKTTTRSQLSCMIKAYQAQMNQERIVASYEIFYVRART